MPVFLAICSIKVEVNNIATVNFMNYQKQCAATLRGVIGYVSQKKKTGIERENLDLKHFEYGLLPQKNNAIKLVSGLNCTPETAYSEFILTKAIHNKNNGVQFYHYTQSFKDGENISPKTAHEIALKFAEDNYKDFEVLVATHIDNEHLHSHFIINSVSFKTGKKLHQPPDTLRKLRFSSDNICKEYGLTTLETYTFGRSKTMGRAEKRAQESGTSWKFELCLIIEKCMKKSKTKADFVEDIQSEGYQIKWTDSRKNITYTCPNGRAVRDDKLYGKKYLKENMELEFNIREQNINSDTNTGWEYEREQLFKLAIQKANALTLEVGQEIITAINRYEKADNYDDELAEITSLAALTALSFIGVYALIELLQNDPSDSIALGELEVMLEEIKQEPENTQEFEQEQEQKQQHGFTMTMM